MCCPPCAAVDAPCGFVFQNPDHQVGWGAWIHVNGPWPGSALLPVATGPGILASVRRAWWPAEAALLAHELQQRQWHVPVLHVKEGLRQKCHPARSAAGQVVMPTVAADVAFGLGRCAPVPLRQPMPTCLSMGNGLPGTLPSPSGPQALDGTALHALHSAAN